MATFNFNTFEEAKNYALSINSEVHIYTQRAGENSWYDGGAIYKAIEVHTDDGSHQWFETYESARDIIANIEDYNYWLKTFHAERICEALANADVEQAQGLTNYAVDIKDAVEGLEDGEVVAIKDSDFDVIELHPTCGEYDNRRWTIGVPDVNKD